VRGLPQIRGCPRNCERRAESRLPLGIACPGRRHEATTREPGDLPSQLFLEAWRVSRAWSLVLEIERVPLELNAASEAVGPPVDSGSVTIVVCRTCRDSSGSDAEPRPGKLLAAATRDAAAPHGIPVAEVECLGNCKRRLSAALLKAGAWSYVFGDLAVDSGADLVEGARLFTTSVDGLLPWRGRPALLKRGLVARIPPLALIGTQS
jgi:predicted metal-binding protein